MTPELILLNADIRTMDAALPRAQAMAVAGGRILALGPDADIRTMAAKATRIIDAGGRLVLPGFQDAHIHLQMGGIDLVQTAQLYDATTIAELQAALAAHAAAYPGPMVWGAGWQAVLHAANRPISFCLTATSSPATPMTSAAPRCC